MPQTIDDLEAATASTAGHHTSLLTPVRSGELRKVSARCGCGWRAVGIAATRDDAVAHGRRLTEQHVASVVPDEVPDEVTATGDAAARGFWSLVTAAFGR